MSITANGENTQSAQTSESDVSDGKGTNNFVNNQGKADFSLESGERRFGIEAANEGGIKDIEAELAEVDDRLFDMEQEKKADSAEYKELSSRFEELQMEYEEELKSGKIGMKAKYDEAPNVRLSREGVASTDSADSVEGMPAGDTAGTEADGGEASLGGGK